jgi:hypothetical protein
MNVDILQPILVRAIYTSFLLQTIITRKIQIMAQEGLLFQYWPPIQTVLYIKFTYYYVVLGEGKMKKQLF